MKLHVEVNVIWFKVYIHKHLWSSRQISLCINIYIYIIENGLLNFTQLPGKLIYMIKKKFTSKTWMTGLPKGCKIHNSCRRQCNETLDIYNSSSLSLILNLTLNSSFQDFVLNEEKIQILKISSLICAYFKVNDFILNLNLGLYYS